MGRFAGDRGYQRCPCLLFLRGNVGSAPVRQREHGRPSAHTSAFSVLTFARAAGEGTTVVLDGTSKGHRLLGRIERGAALQSLVLFVLAPPFAFPYAFLCSLEEMMYVCGAAAWTG